MRISTNQVRHRARSRGVSVLGAFATVAATVAVLVVGVAAPASAVMAENPYAGYVVTEAGTASAAVSFTVPTVTCPSSTFQAVAAGIAFVTDAGKTGAFVALVCNNGSPSLAALTEFNGASAFLPDAVVAGDKMTVSGSADPAGASVTIKDHTAHWTETRSGAGGNVSLAVVGNLAVNCIGTACSPVPNFNSMHFTRATIDGASLSGATKVKLIDSTGAVEATTGNLTVAGGFKTTWKHSCSPDGSGRC